VATYEDPPGFVEWEATVPESYRRDPIWRTPAYRYGLWASELAREDIKRLRANRDSRNDADQLLRAINSISANIAEGYGRRTGGERARYYDYALASAREARDWYFKARRVLGPELVEHRLQLLERIVRILVAIIPRERSQHTRRTEARKRDPSGEG
jgi:four helix bundle protein